MNSLIEKYKMYGSSKFISIALAELRYKLFMQFMKGSYSQYGEDLILDKLMSCKKRGFYVDIGAYDPQRFSNTKRFYQRGWYGINIEPNINNYNKFVEDRQKDINLNVGIGTREGKMNFYRFIPDTLSTFSKQEAESYIKKGYKSIDVKRVRMTTLRNIFIQYCPNNEIDFISIDTEGYNLEVLKSNNWNKFRPKFICIESVNISTESDGIKNTKLHNFLIRKGYKKIYNNRINSIYQNGK